MNKQEFLAALEKWLSALPREEAQERLSFYSEMIDDRMEEGLSEEEAVGSIDEILQQIAADTPPAVIIQETPNARKTRSAGEIALLILGAPLWIPLLIAAFAVALSLYLSLWAILISLWSVFVSLIASAAACIIAGIVLLCSSHALSGLLALAAGLVCTGLTILAFFGCRAATQGSILLTKACITWCKTRITKKEAV